MFALQCVGGLSAFGGLGVGFMITKDARDSVLFSGQIDCASLLMRRTSSRLQASHLWLQLPRAVLLSLVDFALVSVVDYFFLASFVLDN